MSKKFNFDDYKGKYVMHCKTEEEAKDFCRVMHEAGRKWNGGESYNELTAWGYGCFFNNEIYYQFNDGLFTSKAIFVRDYTILEWSDFVNTEFTKDDLRNGDVVLRRDGNVEIYIQSRFVDSNSCCYCSNGVNHDLTATINNGIIRDIMAVRRPNDISDMSFDAFEKKLGRLVYERDETVEMTLEEVCKALGKNVKIVKE